MKQEDLKELFNDPELMQLIQYYSKGIRTRVYNSIIKDYKKAILTLVVSKLKENKIDYSKTMFTRNSIDIYTEDCIIKLSEDGIFFE